MCRGGIGRDPWRQEGGGSLGKTLAITHAWCMPLLSYLIALSPNISNSPVHPYCRAAHVDSHQGTKGVGV